MLTPRDTGSRPVHTPQRPWAAAAQAVGRLSLALLSQSCLCLSSAPLKAGPCAAGWAWATRHTDAALGAL